MFRKWIKDAKFIELPEGTGRVKVPSDEMNRVYLLVHLYRHVFSEGIGLRQMADYAVFLSKGCTEEDKAIAMEHLKELNMTKFAGARTGGQLPADCSGRETWQNFATNYIRWW